MKLHTYSPSTLALYNAPSDVPWPCLWMLANFSGKYRFVSGAKPDVCKLAQDLGQQFAKLRLFCNTRGNSNPDAINWFNAFRSKAVRNAVGLANSHAWKPNLFPLLKGGISLLRNVAYHIVKNDKEPGYAFIPLDVLDEVESNSLKAPLYAPVACNLINWMSLRRSYQRIASRVAHTTGTKSLFTSIVGSASKGLVCALLGLTCKSHKDQGAVVMRTIHRGLQPCFQGLSKWVVSILHPILDVPWTRQDTAHFTQAVKTCVVDADSKSGCFDLKDFYLSGEAFDIAHDVSCYFSGALKSIVFDAIFFLLDNQYVITNRLASLYKCTRGSGIGLLHAGHLTSAHFILKVELPLLKNDMSGCRENGVRHYSRYHDDICCITDNVTSMRLWFGKLQLAGLPTYVIECRQIGSYENPVDFLDVTLSMSDCKVFVRPTQVKPLTPLCPTSAHAFSVHSGWPKAIVYRAAAISTCGLQNTFSTMQDRYSRANAHKYTLALLSDAIQTHSSSQPSPPSSSNPHASNPDPLFAIVCGFHPVFRVAVNRALSTFPPPRSFNRKVCVSWKNVLPMLDKYALQSRIEFKVQGSRESPRQREGLLFFVNSYNINLELINVRCNDTPCGLGLLALSSICLSAERG